MNNFGDLLGPVVVEHLARTSGIDLTVPRERDDRTLFSVGSVLHFAADGDVLWGTGRNGKIEAQRHTFSSLDVRAVRGPRTAAFLRGMGIAAPEVYGDPGLLVPEVFPHLRAIASAPTREISIVPNLHDFPKYANVPGVVNPQWALSTVLENIATSSLVIGSSLHGIVVAEALGIPARLIAPEHEDPFKYQDYYEGTGRRSFTPAPDVASALSLGGEVPPVLDLAPLRGAFPSDLWSDGRPAPDSKRPTTHN
ncbi:polysaccharide pyruvyl transferase family protein [Microbacterium sp. RURRCA19A]|uniref:polysaccharide pyruvyl transferase family protein n=1 Tax=Microbacterium sp. RURRCA19A TaxID=1907391 RepID=UPI00158BEE16|nr:polysaccharide pyruvyl transferase family protein [Microbacterium sp. RURRCA19A]